MNYQELIRRKTDTDADGGTMVRALGLRDVTFLGIAAIIGAGIFGTVGRAVQEGGPAVALLFVFTAVACGLSALCYAVFASRIHGSGSAYTYIYHSLGELPAWIIGWDLIMEYTIGNIAVAISWSDYFTSFLRSMHIAFPEWLSTDWRSAYLASTTKDITTEAGKAWQSAPRISNVPVIMDVPALAITVLITALVYVGISETKRTNNLMVWLKLGILLVVLVAGAFFIDVDNWTPFAPEGLSGVMKGVSAVFFAYIGFDAVSTAAAECRRPGYDLPRAMLYSLLICTVIYVLVVFVLSGMAPYHTLGIGDPLYFIFQQKGIPFLPGLIAFGAIIAMTGVLLVFQLGQPRIWLAMSRDGLLPPVFGKIHPKYLTPSFATILTGIVVAVPALFMNLTEVTDLCSIGTLFAFMLVCVGLLFTPGQGSTGFAFTLPYWDSRLPMTLLAVMGAMSICYFQVSIFALAVHDVVFLLFFVVALGASFLRRLSFIPLAGALINLYLMAQTGPTNWARFGVWLCVGLAIYFMYSFHHSKLKSPKV